MPLLKVKVERKGTKRNIGGYFPTYIDSYLTLRSLAEAVTKTSIMQSIFQKWVASGRVNQPEKQLIETIINRYNAHWKVIQTEHTKITIDQYKEEIREELLSKGLSEEIVMKIIKGIQK